MSYPERKAAEWKARAKEPAPTSDDIFVNDWARMLGIAVPPKSSKPTTGVFSTMSAASTDKPPESKRMQYPIQYETFDEEFIGSPQTLLVFICARCGEKAKVEKYQKLLAKGELLFFLRCHGQETSTIVTMEQAANACGYNEPGRILCFEDEAPPKKEPKMQAYPLPKRKAPRAPLNILSGRRKIELEDE